MLGLRLGQRGVARADAQLASGRHGVPGIDGQVDESVVELVRIGLNVPQPGRQIDVQRDVFAAGADEQGVQPVQGGLYIHGARVERLAAREGEQALGERRRPARGSEARLDIAAQVVDALLRQALADQLQRQDDALQHVVQVVCDAAGQLAQGLHLLALAHLVFRMAQRIGLGAIVRHIAAHGLDETFAGHRRPRDPAGGAAAVAKAQGAIAPRRAFLQRLQRLLHERHVVRVNEGQRVAADGLGLAPAQRARPRRVDRCDAAIETRHHQQGVGAHPQPVAVGRAVGYLLLQRCGGLAGQGLGHLLARGLDDGVQHAHHLAMLVAHRAVAEGEVSGFGPPVAVDGQLEVFDESGMSRHRPVRNGADGAPGFAPYVLERPAEGFGLVAQDDAERVVVDGDHAGAPYQACSDVRAEHRFHRHPQHHRPLADGAKGRARPVELPDALAHMSRSAGKGRRARGCGGHGSGVGCTLAMLRRVSGAGAPGGGPLAPGANAGV